MDAVISKEIAIKAYLNGACSLPKIGRRISLLPTAELIWAEDHILTKKEASAITGSELPLWLLSGSGYGSGDGFKVIAELLAKDKT